MEKTTMHGMPLSDVIQRLTSILSEDGNVTVYSLHVVSKELLWNNDKDRIVVHYRKAAKEE